MSEAERCPRCGQPNRCAQASSAQPVQDCWCFHTPIAHQVLDALPVEQRGTRCLCPNCARVLDEPAKPD
ncbi:cysteine-rich CWC family protein [Pseudomonas sp. BMS12]|uniref:cysteine-rich CWC family protein n=1 Tax=Pseudomonas sp. BMS12 TaxID=1796033 RepID=UPI000839F324|nr:cysteine-rich CWC family protein [Pseudomonas sp. BMS12]